MVVLRIGEFSQLAQVTVKTLHHYDDVDLLKPAHIDNFTNYRYYTLEQLPRVHRILALKDMGLSLEQIRLMLESELPLDEIKGMLRLKRAEAHEQMREVQQRLAMIEFRLHMIEAETNFPDLDVVVKSLDPFHCLSFDVPRPPTFEAAWQQMERVVKLISQAVDKGLIHSIGATIDKFYGDALMESASIVYDRHEILHGVKANQNDVEVEGIGRLAVKEEEPVATAVTLLLSAKDSGFINAVEKATLLRRWAVGHGYKTADYLRMYNYRGPMDTLDRDEFIFEAQLPVVSG